MKLKIDHNVNELQRLAWSCRRGMLELDIILSNFLQEEFLKLNTDQKQAFTDILQYPDPELFSFLMGNMLPNTPSHSDIILLVREHARKRLSSWSKAI